MNRLIQASLITLVALAPLTPAAAQKGKPAPPPTQPALSFSIIDIPMPSNAKTTLPSAINNAGQVVGGTTQMLTTDTTHSRGWVWTPATASAAAKLETLAWLSDAYPHTWGLNINDEGTVSGLSSSYPSKYSSEGTRATLWLKDRYAAPIDLTDEVRQRGQLAGWVLNAATVLSNPDSNGVYHVACQGNIYNADGSLRLVRQGAVVSMQGGVVLNATPLQYPETGVANPSIDPRGVNREGRVVGATLPVTSSTMCLWTAANYADLSAASTYGSLVTTNIPELANTGDTGVQTHALNDAGTLIGRVSKPTSAFGGTTFLGYIAPATADPSAPYPLRTELTTQMAGTDGDSQVLPTDLNHLNQVVGMVTYATSWARTAVLWQPQRDPVTGLHKQDPLTGKLLYHFYDLSKCSITVPSGTTVSVTQLWDARGINDSGWIVGRGLNNKSQERAYLLKPRQ